MRGRDYCYPPDFTDLHNRLGIRRASTLEAAVSGRSVFRPWDRVSGTVHGWSIAGSVTTPDYALLAYAKGHKIDMTSEKTRAVASLAAELKSQFMRP